VAVTQMNNDAEAMRVEQEGRLTFELEKMKMAMSAIDKRLEKERNQIEVGRLQNERAVIMNQMQMKQREFADMQVSRAMDHQQRDADRQSSERVKTGGVQPNPTGNMAQTLANDRYNMIPGAVG